MKRVLITGSDGFVGHALVKVLLETTDWHIICHQRNQNKSNKRLNEILLDNYKSRIEMTYFDICDAWPNIQNLDIILHTAGVPSVTECIRDPRNAIKSNIIGTFHGLELARTQNLENFVLYSTVDIFGPSKKDLFDAYSRYNSNNPYAATKSSSEELCSAYRITYGIPTCAVHLTNTFGPRCQPERLAALAIKKIYTGDNHFVIHYSDGVISSRSWLHIEEIAQQTLFILSLKEYQSKLAMPKFNLGNDIEIDNLKFISTISDCLNQPFTYEFKSPDRIGHDILFPIDTSEIYQLGFTQKYSFEERMMQTVEWYKNNTYWF